MKKQALQSHPSPRQIQALLTLYRLYKLRFPACGQSDGQGEEHAGETERSIPPARGERDADFDQLPLPLFSDHSNVRENRLVWASEILRREIASFSELRADEAALLIDTLKRSLGQKVNPPVRRRRDRDQAHAYGTAGRRDQASKEIQLVDEATLGLIADLVVQLGWNVDRFNSFLCSRTSPVKSGAVRTLAEANRVIWALKRMLRHKEGNSFYRREP